MPGTATLITIPASHYCEKARWALDYAGIAYAESKWPPMLHYLSTFPTSGTKSVPVLVPPSHKALTDSTDIVQYAAAQLEARRASAAGSTSAGLPPPLYPDDPQLRAEVRRLEALFSSKLGVWTRVIVYQAVFSSSKQMQLHVLADGQAGMEGWKRRAIRVLLPMVRGMISKGLRVSAANAHSCAQRVAAAFADVDALLADGRRYLVGGAFSAADLAFASMASLVLCPPAYGAAIPSLEDYPPGFPGRQLRDTPAGRHALAMFELHRGFFGRPPEVAAATGKASARQDDAGGSDGNGGPPHVPPSRL